MNCPFRNRNSRSIATEKEHSNITITVGLAAILYLPWQALSAGGQLPFLPGAEGYGGAIDIDLLSYSPQAGDSYDLLDFNSASGTFTLDLPPLNTGLAWDDTSLLITGELSVIASVFENADFDSDGDSDGKDLLAWQRGFGSPGSPATGDANDDGDVDGVDFGIWQDQFGTAGNSADAAQSLPEPAGPTLIAGCLLSLGGF